MFTSPGVRLHDKLPKRFGRFAKWLLAQDEGFGLVCGSTWSSERPREKLGKRPMI